MAEFDSLKEAGLFNLLDKNTNRAGAAAAMHDEFCKLSLAEKTKTFTELLLPYPHTFPAWTFAENGRGDIAGVQPPEKDIVISLDCPK